jgi:NAD(P)-dependent dehydrogenase (short-subunit alcohol dehydrogenase family)
MQGRVVVVTGAFGALGQVVVEVAAARGAATAAIGSAATPPTDVAKRFASATLVVGGIDLTSPEHARAAMTAVKARFGRLDALINVAGAFVWEKIEGGDPRSWQKMFAVNLTTAVNAAQAALPYLLESGAGRIVNVGALAAIKAGAGMGP